MVKKRKLGNLNISYIELKPEGVDSHFFPLSMLMSVSDKKSSNPAVQYEVLTWHGMTHGIRHNIA